MIADPQRVRCLGGELDHPEGCNFGPDGLLYAGGEAGQVYRIDVTSEKVTQIARTGGFHLGVALDGGGAVYACDLKKTQVSRIDPDGQVSVYTRGTPDRPLEVPNYAVFDRDGNLYVSDSGDYWNPEGTGRIYVVSPRGDTSVFHPGPFRFANGLAIDPAGECLYIVESTRPGVVRIPLGQGRPHEENPEVVVLMPDCVPDGLAFDTAGRLYISCYKPDAIYRLADSGELETVVHDPTGELMSRPTNIALGEQKLYFANLGGWHIGVVAIDAEGAPLHYPQLGS